MYRNAILALRTSAADDENVWKYQPDSSFELIPVLLALLPIRELISATSDLSNSAWETETRVLEYVATS